VLGNLREWYERKIDPFGRAVSRLKISPNLLTILSAAAAFVAGYLYSKNNLVGGVTLIVLSAVVDMLDGAVARASNRLTRFGATLDHVLDRYAEFFMVFGMVNGGYVDCSVGFFSLFGMLMASFARAKAESVGGLKSCTVGVAERQEKLLLLIGGTLLTYVNPLALNHATLFAGIISHVTVAQRLHFTWVKTGGK
jgi:CDP-diacylglycerol--glycerol-3-phosphate 3-phosphatidyltransferase/archaetidylinositol phosphate synthase